MRGKPIGIGVMALALKHKRIIFLSYICGDERRQNSIYSLKYM